MKNKNNLENSYLRLVGGTDLESTSIEGLNKLAFMANELYVHIAKSFPDSQFKENMLKHVRSEQHKVIMDVVYSFNDAPKASSKELSELKTLLGDET